MASTAANANNVINGVFGDKPGELDYRYVSAGSTFGAISGFKINSSFPIFDDLAIEGGYETNEESDSNFDLSTTDLRVSATFHRNVSFFDNTGFFKKTDLLTSVHLQQITVKATARLFGFEESSSVSETIVQLGFGLRSLISDSIELNAQVRVCAICDGTGVGRGAGSSFSVGVAAGGKYKIMDSLFVVGDIDMTSLGDYFFTGVEYRF